MIYKHSSCDASAVVFALMTAVVLAGIGAGALMVIQNQYRHSHQVSGWEESLQAAEAGIDIAVAELRKTLYDPENAFSGWQTASDDPLAQPDPASGPVYATSFLPNRDTEGGRNSHADVTIEAPPFLVDSRGAQWYRIRAAGYADVPGGTIAVANAQDRALRKIDFRFDRDTQQALAAPRAKRTIEAIVKPTTAFALALFGTNAIDMNNENIVVDSYDSRDPLRSTRGNYDPLKRTQNGDIATNGKVIEAGKAQIYGDASTNGGSVLNAENVHGEIYDDFYQDTFSVKAPVLTPEPGSPATVTSTTVLTASPSQPSEYNLAAIKLSGQNTLRIKGAADGSNTYAQIVVSGDITLSGQAQIIVDPGVKVRIFVRGNADISGNGIMNTNAPLNLQIYGVDRPKNADGTEPAPGIMKIAGNGAFKGAVYAPNYNLEMVGGGHTDSIYGAFVGLNVRMTGVQSVHYDEALSENGLISDYKIVSWFEDVK